MDEDGNEYQRPKEDIYDFEKEDDPTPFYDNFKMDDFKEAYIDDL